MVSMVAWCSDSSSRKSGPLSTSVSSDFNRLLKRPASLRQNLLATFEPPPLIKEARLDHFRRLAFLETQNRVIPPARK